MFSIRTVVVVATLSGCLFSSGCGSSGDAAIAENHRDSSQPAEPAAKANPGHRRGVDRVSGSPVTATLSLEPAQVKRGDEVLLTVKLEIEPLWEVRALEEHQSAEATRIDLELPVTIAADGDWQAPRAARSIAPDGHSVYVGEAVFRRKLRVAPESMTGEVPVKCRLQYQACNDQQCLAPAEVELAVDLHVQ